MLAKSKIGQYAIAADYLSTRTHHLQGKRKRVGRASNFDLVSNYGAVLFGRVSYAPYFQFPMDFLVDTILIKAPAISLPKVRRWGKDGALCQYEARESDT